MFWKRAALAAFLAAFLPLLLVAPEHLFHIIRSMAFTISCGLVAAYSAVVARILFVKSYGMLTPGESLCVGIWLAWIGIGGHMGNNIVAQFAPNPPLQVHAVVGAFFMWLALAGAAIQLLSSEFSVDGAIPARGAIRLGVIVTIAVGIAMASAFALHPHAWWTGTLHMERPT